MHQLIIINIRLQFFVYFQILSMNKEKNRKSSHCIKNAHSPSKSIQKRPCALKENAFGCLYTSKSNKTVKKRTQTLGSQSCASPHRNNPSFSPLKNRHSPKKFQNSKESVLKQYYQFNSKKSQMKRSINDNWIPSHKAMKNTVEFNQNLRHQTKGKSSNLKRELKKGLFSKISQQYFKMKQKCIKAVQNAQNKKVSAQKDMQNSIQNKNSDSLNPQTQFIQLKCRINSYDNSASQKKIEGKLQIDRKENIIFQSAEAMIQPVLCKVKAKNQDNEKVDQPKQSQLKVSYLPEQSFLGMANHYTALKQQRTEESIIRQYLIQVRHSQNELNDKKQQLGESIRSPFQLLSENSEIKEDVLIIGQIEKEQATKRMPRFGTDKPQVVYLKTIYLSQGVSVRPYCKKNCGQKCNCLLEGLRILK